MMTREKSSCGVGFIASLHGLRSHKTVAKSLEALSSIEHRGACSSDQVSSDGAGILTEIPFDILGYRPGEVAVASMLINPPENLLRPLLKVFEEVFGFWGMKVLEYRQVPVNLEVLGPQARASKPEIIQAILSRPKHCNTDSSFNKLMHIAKQMTVTKQKDVHPEQLMFFASLSSETIVYKALTKAADLGEFYLDLRNPKFVSRYALFHRRFSTNTSTSWDKAQPFRLIAHNGEINTIDGNRAWAYSCEKSMGLPENELLTHKGISDSGSLNEMAEALMYRSSLPRALDVLSIMIPPAHPEKSFYKFWGRAMDPWDGPALIAFCDGPTIGARLDRNGFRPCRWSVTENNFYLCSEAGSFQLDESKILRKGALRAGSCVQVDTKTGRIDFTDASNTPENREFHFDPRLKELPYVAPEDSSYFPDRKFLFSFTEEELQKFIIPMAKDGKEPIGSMGDTARPAVLSNEPRSFFDFFFQNFAQVTNPPFDYLREKTVTDLCVHLGVKPNIFAKKDLIPPPQALELPSPLMGLGQMESLLNGGWVNYVELPLTFPKNFGTVGFEKTLKDLKTKAVEAVNSGISVLILSDQSADFENPPLPALLGLRSVMQGLDDAGLGLRASIVMHTGQVNNAHHAATLIGFGATAVCPYLSLQIARHDLSLESLSPDTKEKNYLSALQSGVLRIMAKMGISVVGSYRGAKLFTIVGLDKTFSQSFFPGVTNHLGGFGLNEIVESLLLENQRAQKALEEQKLIHTYQWREHAQGKLGEKHSMTAAKARLLQKAVANPELWNDFKVAVESDYPVNVRHLLKFKESEAANDVEPASAIVQRFGSGAMSFGAISAESQRDIIEAMRELNARSNSGEGGENPYYWTHGISASTKQVASGRFGVNATYLVTGKEIQIKIAQGAKPGEGGQLMAIKVDADIARARMSSVGVDLISPPPLHDIYSIEDLKELIYELRQVNSNAKISVKLVSGANIGTIAVGVAKAGADIIHVAGGDGGTGAATVTSMKHAGLPFEFGLIEVHNALTENNLRHKITLRADGGLTTGRDVVTTCLLGADEFDFGKLLLVAQGCIMARVCEKNTCPTGIATHDPKFKAKYKGNKGQIVNLLHLIAEDVRGYLKSMGFSKLSEIIGRRDLLIPDPQFAELIKSRGIDLSSFFVPRPLVFSLNQPRESSISELNQRILDDAQKSDHLKYSITSTDRGVGATLSGAIASQRSLAHEAQIRGEQISTPEKSLRVEFTGSAGQGFGAFLESGLHFKLFGEANDSAGKGLSGGTLVIRPPLNSNLDSSENVIVGNGALYGGTKGIFFARGQACDRFAVRNSGVRAVVEGAGLHACEYMTGGFVAILGPTDENVGSGMTGGELFLYKPDSRLINDQFIVNEQPDSAKWDELRVLLTHYLQETESPLVAEILANWETEQEYFRYYKPKPQAQKVSMTSIQSPIGTISLT